MAKYFKLLLFLSVIVLNACKTRDLGAVTTARNAAQVQTSLLPIPDLSGDSLGYIDYDGIGKRRAVRVYFKKVPNLADAYNVVVVEYPRMLSIFPKFISTPKSEEELENESVAKKFGNGVKSVLHKLTGDLKHILSRVKVYRAVLKTENPPTFALHEMSYDPVTQSLKIEGGDKYSVLKLSRAETRDLALAGATISASPNGEPAPVVIPKNKMGNGIEWRLTSIAYSFARLESTWRDDFLTGNYLSTYGNRERVILNLSKLDKALQARFLDFKEQKIPQSEFTNPDSARIYGLFEVKMLQPGIFTFVPNASGGQKGQEHVIQKLGLFLDVFDATKSLNMDVVEFVLADNKLPRQFLMYFEDPLNGEGQ